MPEDPSDQPLPHRLVIYLPFSEGIQSKVLHAVQHLLCLRLGGATCYQAQGIFLRKSGKREIEELRVVETYCEDSDRNSHIIFLRRLAAALGKVLDQEAIAIGVDGRMEHVTPHSGVRSLGIAGLTVPELGEHLQSMTADST